MYAGAFLHGTCITHVDTLQHAHVCIQYSKHLNTISSISIYKLCSNTAYNCLITIYM